MCCLSSYVNVRGEEAMGRRVRAERTHVERVAARMAERKEETWRPMTQNRVAAFIRLYLLAIVMTKTLTTTQKKKEIKENFEQSFGEACHPLHLSQSCVVDGRVYVAHNNGEL